MRQESQRASEIGKKKKKTKKKVHRCCHRCCSGHRTWVEPDARSFRLSMTSQVLAGCCCRCCDRDSPGVHMKPMGVLSMTLALLVAAQTKVISEQTQAGRQQQEQQDGFIILETTIRVYPTYRNPSATSTTATTSPCVLIALFLFLFFLFLPPFFFVHSHSFGRRRSGGGHKWVVKSSHRGG